MNEQEEALKRFSRELAEYTANGRIGTQLNQYIEEILRNKLNSTERFEVIIDIMAYISMGVIYIISNLNVEKLNKNNIEKFSTMYGKETLDVLQALEGWTENMSKRYGEIIESQRKIYSNTLGNNYLPKEDDYKRLWEKFAFFIITNLNVDDRLKNEAGLLTWLSKTIQLDLAKINKEIAHKLDKNMNLFS